MTTTTKATKATKVANKDNKAIKVVDATVNNAAVKEEEEEVKVVVTNTIPFILNDKQHFADLWALFNNIYSLKALRVPGLTRASLFNDLYDNRLLFWQQLKPEDVGTMTPYSVLKKYGMDLYDMLLGEKVASEYLESGKARAFRLSESKSTGVSTYAVTKVLPIVAGDANIVKSLAKKQTADGKLFGIEERDKNGVLSLTVYRVTVKTEPKLDENNQPILDKKGNAVVVKTKIANKVTKSIRRMNKTETAFKKGLSAGLSKAV